MRIGALIRREREARGWTLADLSRRTGIAVSNLSRLERGRSDPRASTLDRIADALDLSLELVPNSPVVSMGELSRAARDARDTILRSGLGPSDPRARLERRASRGDDVSLELSALESRGRQRAR